jgi:hypothetical protein
VLDPFYIAVRVTKLAVRKQVKRLCEEVAFERKRSSVSVQSNKKASESYLLPCVVDIPPMTHPEGARKIRVATIESSLERSMCYGNHSLSVSVNGDL